MIKQNRSVQVFEGDGNEPILLDGLLRASFWVEGMQYKVFISKDEHTRLRAGMKLGRVKITSPPARIGFAVEVEQVVDSQKFSDLTVSAKKIHWTAA